MKNQIIIGILILAVIIGSIIYFLRRTPTVEQTEEVKSVVVEFGTKLKNVSLQLPKEELQKAMMDNYGPYVSQDLLGVWQNDPSLAPGRQTSSPWPEKINILSVTKIDDQSYAVEANVIEVTSAEKEGEVAGVLPIGLGLEFLDGKWIITEFRKGDYSKIPHTTSITGNFVCLPHKETSGPQTTECAYGVKTSNGEYYALSTNLLASRDIVDNLQMNQKIKVNGVLVLIEQISSNKWQAYPIKGIIEATTVEKI
jgi:hypothetical protein